jgi:hypothetical protein
MNGIFGAGPADEDYEDLLADGKSAWEPTFSEGAVARQWDLPPQRAALMPLPSTMRTALAPTVAPSASPSGPAPIMVKPVAPVSPAPPPKSAGFSIPRWLPWMLAIAGVGALVYVVSKKPESKPEAGTV